MWIAACDDDTNFGEIIIQILKEIVFDDDQITYYDNGIDLIETARRSKHPIDIALLDIEMPGLTGIEAARDLREISPGTVIIMLTSFMQYALMCYEVRAYNYLLKPVDIDALRKTIYEIRNKKEYCGKNILHIETREKNLFISFGDILYVESFDRALFVHTRGANYKYFKQISQIEKELRENGFYRIHKSYIVNLSHIRRIDKSSLEAILTSGDKLPVGKRKINGLVSSLIDARRGLHGDV